MTALRNGFSPIEFGCAPFRRVSVEGFEDIVKEFLVESYENLDKLDDDLVALENTPEDRERIAGIFRTIHTIKGTSGFLGLPILERLTHVGESVLVPLRDGDRMLDSTIAECLLEMVDAVRNILDHVEAGEGEGNVNYEPLVAKLESISDTPPAESETAKSETPPNESNGHTETDSPPLSGEPALPPEVFAEPVAEPVAEPRARGTVADSSIRIDVGLLDELINVVGELVLTRNQIARLSASTEDASLTAASQRLNLITSELQERVMKTRMQPIGNLWGKLPRVIRDLANACDKQVVLITKGEDTELDKTILEAIKDPLTHVVRNAIDHGIETPDRRRAAGKSAAGTLSLEASHEGGQVIIEIRDDGSGMDPARIRDKAIEQKLITPMQAESMSDRELIGLVFLPGFSTAQSVTKVSGRGVGMDVVRTNIESIGGILDLHSVIGAGTTHRIKIPLTLAIIPVLIVSSAGNRYAIPQASLQELVRIDGDDVESRVELIHETPVMRLRERLIPLVDLGEVLHARGRGVLGNTHLESRGGINVVVLRAEGQVFGLIVDTISDTQEIVVKSLDGILSGIPVYAGATIMGDGTISLILDVNGVAQTAGVLGGLNASSFSEDEDHVDVSSEPDTDESVLVIDRYDGSRAAIPLSSVTRLERFPASKIEQVGGRNVLQYRGEILPLIAIDREAPAGTHQGGKHNESKELQAVVCQFDDRLAGIVISKIVDIVDVPGIATLNDTPDRESVIDRRVTEILDVQRLVDDASAGRTAQQMPLLEADINVSVD